MPALDRARKAGAQRGPTLTAGPRMASCGLGIGVGCNHLSCAQNLPTRTTCGDCPRTLWPLPWNGDPVARHHNALSAKIPKHARCEDSPSGARTSMHHANMFVEIPSRAINAMHAALTEQLQTRGMWDINMQTLGVIFDTTPDTTPTNAAATRIVMLQASATPGDQDACPNDSAGW